jgi:hypothetical protein
MAPQRPSPRAVTHASSMDLDAGVSLVRRRRHVTKRTTEKKVVAPATGRDGVSPPRFTYNNAALSPRLEEAAAHVSPPHFSPGRMYGLTSAQMLISGPPASSRAIDRRQRPSLDLSAVAAAHTQLGERGAPSGSQSARADLSGAGDRAAVEVASGSVTARADARREYASSPLVTRTSVVQDQSCAAAATPQSLFDLQCICELCVCGYVAVRVAAFACHWCSATAVSNQRGQAALHAVRCRSRSRCVVLLFCTDTIAAGHQCTPQGRAAW